MSAQSPDEVFDVVNADDYVISQATRAEVHAQGLLHRAVHVFVFNSRGELLLQKRSRFKDEFPLQWTSSASGHLDAGETYADAAVRELQEELGMTAELEFVTKLPASPHTANEHTALFRCVSDATPRIAAEEIERVESFSVNAVQELIAQFPATVSLPFRSLFQYYREHFA